MGRYTNHKPLPRVSTVLPADAAMLLREASRVKDEAACEEAVRKAILWVKNRHPGFFKAQSLLETITGDDRAL